MEEHKIQTGHVLGMLFSCLMLGRILAVFLMKIMILGVQLKFGFIKCFKCDCYIYHDDILDRVQGNLMPSFSLHTLKMKFQKLVDIMKDSQDHPDRQYVHSHCTVGKEIIIFLK